MPWSYECVVLTRCQYCYGAVHARARGVPVLYVLLPSPMRAVELSTAHNKHRSSQNEQQQQQQHDFISPPAA
eukprot:1601332-Rhodomonas_salina.2